MRPPFSGKPSPLGGPHYPLSIGEWLLPLISLESDRGQPQVRTLPIAKSLARSSARVSQTPPLPIWKRKTRRLGVWSKGGDVDCWSWEGSRSAFDGRGGCG